MGGRAGCISLLFSFAAVWRIQKAFLSGVSLLCRLPSMLRENASTTLRKVQRRLHSNVATCALLFPEGLCRDVSYRLETARLVINHQEWLTFSLGPLLSEADPENMWDPDQLKKVILAAARSETQPVILEDYLRD